MIYDVNADAGKFLRQPGRVSVADFLGESEKDQRTGHDIESR
jgi:hypothetical protein